MIDRVQVYIVTQINQVESVIHFQIELNDRDIQT